MLTLPSNPFAHDAPLPRVARVTSRPSSLWSIVRAERVDLSGGGFALVLWETMANDRGPCRLTFGGEVAVSVMDDPGPYYGGWKGVARALGHVLSMCITDPPGDATALTNLYHAVDRTLSAMGADATPRDIAAAARADLAKWAAFMAETDEPTVPLDEVF